LNTSKNSPEEVANPPPSGLSLFLCGIQDDPRHFLTSRTAKPADFSEKVFNTPFVDKAPPQVYTDNISNTDRS
jgi:hypothetical protein